MKDLMEFKQLQMKEKEKIDREKYINEKMDEQN